MLTYPINKNQHKSFHTTGILQRISFRIPSGIPPVIHSGSHLGIPLVNAPGTSSDICARILPGNSPGILADVPSTIPSRILLGIHKGILPENHLGSALVISANMPPENAEILCLH